MQLRGVDMMRFKRFCTKKFERIIIHHSWSPDSKQSYDWEAIDKYHKVDNGWLEIGYHFGLEYVEGILQLCIGRSLTQYGSHAVGFNDGSIGICLVGCYDDKPPDGLQYEILADLCFALCRQFDIKPFNIRPHSEFNSQKTCPGRMFDMMKLRTMVGGKLNPIQEVSNEKDNNSNYTINSNC